MATVSVKLTTYTTVTITYTLANESGYADTRYRFTMTGVQFANSRSGGITEKVYFDVYTLSMPSYGIDWGGNGVGATLAKGTKKRSWSTTEWVVFQKQHGAKTVNVPIRINMYTTDGSGEWETTKNISISIPSKTTYTVTLNANGGSGGTASLTKWYGEPLNLTVGFSAPTRTGYKFIGWSTTTENAAAGITASSYTDNNATTLYAAWKPVISAIGMNVHTLRVDAVGNTEESDDSEVCYGIIEYAMVGVATASSTFDITAPSGVVFEGHVAGEENHLTVTKTKDSAEDVYSSFTFYATECGTENNYEFAASMVTSNTEWTAQETLSLEKTDVLSAAYFPMDILGDAYWDSANQTGERPGHGLAIGLPAKKEGFAVGMDIFFQQWAGVIQMFAGSTPPAGWLLCDGSAVSRTEYETLYTAIGDTWGAGDGSTTFNLPDLRGRAPIGAGTGSGLTARTLGGTVGEETVTLTGPQSGIQAHSAAVAASWYISTYKGTRSTETVGAIGGSGFEISQVKSSGGSWSGQNSISIAAKNATQAHDNMQPSAVVNFIIHTGKVN